MMELFYIGDRFYNESGTMMSCIYHVGTKFRSDWGKVNIALSRGESVHIRPATAEERAWADAKLIDTQAEMKRIFG